MSGYSTSPSRSLVPLAVQTSAIARGFLPTAPEFTAETDSPLEGSGFELVVPRHESPRFPDQRKQAETADTKPKRACLAAVTSARRRGCIAAVELDLAVGGSFRGQGREDNAPHRYSSCYGNRAFRCRNHAGNCRAAK